LNYILDVDIDIQLANDCASGAFARLHVLNSESQSSLSSQDACPTTAVTNVKTSSQRPSRSFLPAELLLNIFQFVYTMSIQTPESPLSKSSMEWKNEDSLSPSLFPYAIASVCSFWRDVMLMTPAFWTRIVILIDARPTPLSMIECQIAWTQNLPIDVTITRRIALRALGEQAQVASVMAIIVPQLYRCQKLCVDVSLSSSLPSFPSSFHGYAPLLEELQLECDFDDGDSSSLETQTTTPFECPALWKLAMDGRNFHNTCEEGIWTWLDLPAVTNLSISHFTRHPDPLLLQNLLSALSVIPNIAHLRLTDLALDPPDNSEAYHFISPSLLYSLVCEDIGDMDALECLIEYFKEIPELTLTRCAARNATCEADTLTLKEMHHNVDDVDRMLGFWSGRNLYLDSCPGFDDAFLERMYVPSNVVIARSMKHLDISNCLNFSAPALKRFVESRRHADGDRKALASMRILGNRPYFSPEDRLWFKEHLSHFFIFTPGRHISG
jgi:hypothetical protein